MFCMRSGGFGGLGGFGGENLRVAIHGLPSWRIAGWVAIQFRSLPSDVALNTPFAPKPILRPNVTGVKCVQGVVNACSDERCVSYSFNAMHE